MEEEKEEERGRSIIKKVTSNVEIYILEGFNMKTSIKVNEDFKDKSFKYYDIEGVLKIPYCGDLVDQEDQSLWEFYDGDDVSDILDQLGVDKEKYSLQRSCYDDWELIYIMPEEELSKNEIKSETLKKYSYGYFNMKKALSDPKKGHVEGCVCRKCKNRKRRIMEVIESD